MNYSQGSYAIKLYDNELNSPQYIFKHYQSLQLKNSQICNQSFNTVDKTRSLTPNTVSETVLFKSYDAFNQPMLSKPRITLSVSTHYNLTNSYTTNILLHKAISDTTTAELTLQ